MGRRQVRRILEAGTIVIDGIGSISITRKGMFRPVSVVHFVPSDTLVGALRELDYVDGEECGRRAEEPQQER